MHVLRDVGASVIAVPIRKGRRTELESQGWTCAGSLPEAADTGAVAAVIATDTGRHVEDAGEALRLGLHVLVEKPMAVSAEGGRELLSLASTENRRVIVGCDLRFDSGLQELRQRLGEIGQVHAVNIECRSYLPDWRPGRDCRLGYWAKLEEGGVLRDLIHEVDYALWLFGMPDRVFGTLRPGTRLGIESEECAQGLWTAPLGASVSLGLDYLTRRAQRDIHVLGSDGEIEYDFVARRLTIQTANARATREEFPNTANDYYVAQAKGFLDAISGGSSGVAATVKDGLLALAVCDAWRKSSQTGCMEGVVL
jgi:predicted dehydrogenase